jgi:hypothetical protein
MDVKINLIEDDIVIVGLSIESTALELEDFNKDMEKLYNNLIHSGKMELLNKITQNSREYYGVTWYGTDEADDGFTWLLGQKIHEKTDNLEIKIIRKGEYAVCKFPPKYDAIKAWTDLYAEGIPGIGYKPIEENNIAFVYYPNGLDGENEIWALVEKA